jgi:hypothetical protein
MPIARPAKIQNDLRAMMEEVEPQMKAIASVMEVSVIEGPA